MARVARACLERMEQQKNTSPISGGGALSLLLVLCLDLEREAAVQKQSAASCTPTQANGGSNGSAKSERRNAWRRAAISLVRPPSHFTTDLEPGCDASLS